jgi:hypothetical protein
MVTETEQAEYLDEIRTQVCSRCVERPPGGPPCEPLGKFCGVELHLPELIESIHQVHSPLMQPYLEQNRNEICSGCDFLHSSVCPCPMDSLAMLVVEAVEAVDQRRQGMRSAIVRALTQCSNRSVARRRAEEGRNLTAGLKEKSVEDLEAVFRAYQKGTGTWTGCDWPTDFGKTGLDLNGWTAAQAEAMFLETMDTTRQQDWRVAVRWLAVIERRAQEAETKAAAAVAAAGAGRWEEALHNAELAGSLEFSTGRALRHGLPLAWQTLREEIEAGYIAHQLKEE